MNRREFLGCGAVALPAVALAHVDERGMAQPDEGDACLDLIIRTPISWGAEIGAVVSVGRAVFEFGAYEKLLEHNKAKEPYSFRYLGKWYRIAATSLSVDVTGGCVVCIVQGRLY